MKQFKQISLYLSFALLLQGCTAYGDRQKIDNWHRLLATGEAALAKHDNAAAEKSFEEAVKISAPFTKEPVRLAISLEDLSKVCLATSDVRQAATICDQALALANKRTQTPARQLDVLESSLGQCLNNVAQVFAKAKKYDQSAIAFREARAIFLDLYKRTPPTLSNYIIGSYVAWTVDGLGTSYKELGQLKEARQAYLSVQDYNIIKGLSMELRGKLVAGYCQIPDTNSADKQKFADLLGCPLPVQ